MRVGTFESVLSDLTERAAALQLSDIPTATVRHAALVFADTVGVIMAGNRQPELAALLRNSTLLGIQQLSTKKPHSVVLSPSYPAAPPTIAAMINGAAATSLELDEGVRPTGHPAAHIVPAVLAIAQEAGNSGEEVLAAFVSGYEVAARLFQCLELRGPVHPHGHLGAVGAAVAAARLRRISPSGAALAAATVPILGTWEACYEGATMRNLYTGFGASSAVAAVEFAASGFTGSLSSLKTFVYRASRGMRNPEMLTSAIDPTNLRIAKSYFKLHSACSLSHSAIDAVLSMGSLDLSQVRNIEVETCERAMRLARRSAGNPLSSRFSLPYTVATAAKHGRATWDAFSPDPEVARLASRVRVRDNPAMTAEWPKRLRARVTITMVTGEQVCREVENPLGHASRRPDPQLLRQKFLELSRSPKSSELYARLVALASEKDVYTLFVETSDDGQLGHNQG